MSRLLSAVKASLACVAVVSVLALPGAVSGFDGCNCPGCRVTPQGCFKYDICPNNICNWNGPECDCDT